MIKCSKIQPNQMQCTRAAEWQKSGDEKQTPEFKHALCNTCYLLAGKPEGYSQIQ